MITVNRTITPVFNRSDFDKPTGDVLEYSPTVKNIPYGSDYNETEEVSSVNYEAISLWWQM